MGRRVVEVEGVHREIERVSVATLIVLRQSGLDGSGSTEEDFGARTSSDGTSHMLCQERQTHLIRG